MTRSECHASAVQIQKGSCFNSQSLIDFAALLATQEIYATGPCVLVVLI